MAPCERRSWMTQLLAQLRARNKTTIKVRERIICCDRVCRHLDWWDKRDQRTPFATDVSSFTQFKVYPVQSKHLLAFDRSCMLRRRVSWWVDVQQALGPTVFRIYTRCRLHPVFASYGQSRSGRLVGTGKQSDRWHNRRKPKRKSFDFITCFLNFKGVSFLITYLNLIMYYI